MYPHVGANLNLCEREGDYDVPPRSPQGIDHVHGNALGPHEGVPAFGTMDHMPPMTPSKAIKAFEVPGHDAWYVIGYGEDRVTVYTQQVRALNLAWALKESGRMVQGPVVVVGGGAAGLAAAAGLAHLGAEVTVLERESHVLPLQRNCYKRHLHPHVFDWPLETSANINAGLPLLTWRAGMAREVARSLETAFFDLTSEHRRLGCVTHVSNIRVDLPGPGRIFFATRGETRTLPYGTLIFALGFGLEASFWLGRRGSYWADDGLDQHGVFPPGDYLVSGTGDGGLIDLLRILLVNFRQDKLVRLVEDADGFEQLRTRLIEIEDAATAARDAVRISQGIAAAREREGSVLFEQYQQLSNDGSATQGIDRRIRERIASDVHVTLLSRGASPFSLSSRPLHRLLLSRLLFAFPSALNAHCNVRLSENMLRHEGHKAVLTLGTAKTFDHVVIRHGAGTPLDQFPSLASAMKSWTPTGIGIAPLYPDGYFGPPAIAAWGSGPDEHDYADTLTGPCLIRSRPGAVGAPPESDDIYLELRSEEVVRPPISKRAEYTQNSTQAPPTREDVEQASEADAKRQLEDVYRRRFAEGVSGFALRAADWTHSGVTLLRGRMGTGKSTLLRNLARVAIRAWRGDTERFPVPILVNHPPSLSGDPGDDVPRSLAAAALNTCSLPAQSAAAAYLHSQVLRGRAVFLIDTVDGWSATAFAAVVQWLLRVRCPAVVAARQFPTDAYSSLSADSDQSLRLIELLGVAASSAGRLIRQHCPGVDADLVLSTLGKMQNAREWRTNPRLLTLAGHLQRDPATTAGPSVLALYERVVDKAPRHVRSVLEAIARRDLRADPVQFSFPRVHIPREHLSDVSLSGLVSGEQTLEFSHLSIGEYLASSPPLDLAAARRALRQNGETWHHRLDILPMAHAASLPELRAALSDAQAGDPEHRCLALVLRAVAFGGDVVDTFCRHDGASLVREVASRLSVRSGRFAGPERELMRAMDWALPFLCVAALDVTRLPKHGEPGAEAWALSNALGMQGERRPVESYWWPTVFHQARSLLGLPPRDVAEQTRGGDAWDRGMAIEALPSAEGYASMLVDPFDRVRLSGLRNGDLETWNRQQFGLLCDDDSGVRRRAITSIPDALCTAPSVQFALETIAVEDPSPGVRWAAIARLGPGRMVESLLAQLRELVTPKLRVTLDEQLLLEELLKRLANEPSARDTIDEFLSSGIGWFCPYGAYVALCADESRRRIMLARLESENPGFEEVRAAKGVPEFVPALRGIVRRLLRDAKRTLVLSTAINALPANDAPSRADRLRCLDPSHIPSDDEHAEHKREAIQVAAIASFAADPDASKLLTPFLTQTDSSSLAEAALKAIGDRPEVRSLVWRQLEEGGHNARIRALRLLDEDPAEQAALQRFFDNLNARTASARDILGRAYLRAEALRIIGARRPSAEVIAYLTDRDPQVRDAAVAILVARRDLDEAQREVLRQRALRERSHNARGLLWKHFADDQGVQQMLRVAARPDLAEVRHAYYSLMSEDDSRRAFLKEWFLKILNDNRDDEALAEFVQPLARDEELLHHLRALADSKSDRVCSAVLSVLVGDRILRDEIHRRMTETPEWLQRFEFPNMDALQRYLHDDVVGKRLLLELLRSGKLKRLLHLAVYCLTWISRQPAGRRRREMRWRGQPVVNLALVAFVEAFDENNNHARDEHP